MAGCCSHRSCKFGLLDNSIVDDHDVTVNGTDMVYKSKDFVVVDSDDEGDREQSI